MENCQNVKSWNRTLKIVLRHRETKRKRILECAFDVVLRYGFTRMTMDDVAKEVGISRPALYLQFKNKGEIYSARRRHDGPGA